MGHSSLQVSLTNLRGLEVPALKVKDMPTLWNEKTIVKYKLNTKLKVIFARKTKKNWDSWGDQVGLFDNKKKEEVITRKRPSKWIEPREQLKLIS